MCLLLVMNLLPITFAFLGLFNYGSTYEARVACETWRSNGIELSSGRFKHPKDFNAHGWNGRWTTEFQYSRSCTLEKNTRQYLGFERKEYDAPRRIAKRFRF